MANVAPASVVITSTTGAGQAVTAKTFSNVVDFEVDFVKNTIKIVSDNGLTITYFDYSAIATFTWVITAGVPVLTIS
jgi:hypothetical protein